ncbi:MAG: HAMP domain-containing histidine kinase [Clostridia bacterium]|nr:HAMP domain-containing histidine kinase [Clostridia bacterium]
MEQNMKRSERLRIGIKWKMFAILIIFISILVVVMWVFQIRLMSYFYQQIRFNEMKTTSLSVASSLSHIEQIDSVMENCAQTYDLNLWLFVAEEGGFLRELSETSGSVREHPTLNQQKDLLYRVTQQNGGTYIAVYSDFYEGSSSSILLADNRGTPDSYPFLSTTVERCDAYYSTVFQTQDTTYFLVQNANLTPLPSMVTMLENLFLVTGIFVIFIALLLAVVLTRLITKPIAQMNMAAKRLAKGEYTADFSGKGYREIIELGETLNYAAHELSKNDSLQKELISNVSHDLRTPLTMIRGYGEVMRDIPGENTPENVQVIIDEATRLSDLVNDMLDLSRIQSGIRTPVFGDFCLTDTVREVLHRYEKLTEQSGYQISFYADAEAWVRADRGMILQVVYNLINNAINYTGEDRSVIVTQYVTNGRVRICVADTGEGITEEQIPLIWDRYYKVDKVHRRAMVGTGLGLSIVKGVLELHNASYGVQSTLGEGSVFWFELKMEKQTDSNEETNDEIAP